MFGSRFARLGLGASAGAVSVLVFALSSHAVATCKSVEGHYREHQVSGSGCDSPVGLCIAGDYSGGVNGSFAGQATSIISTADTPATGALLFTSDSAIDASIGKRHGTLIIKNTGGFQTAGDGSIVDLQTIIGGTDDFTGARGQLRAQGHFTTADGGQSEYSGAVCLP